LYKIYSKKPYKKIKNHLKIIKALKTMKTFKKQRKIMEFEYNWI